MHEMSVSILSDGEGKPFSVRPGADDDLTCRNAWNDWIHCQWWVGRPFPVLPAADDDFLGVSVAVI